MRKFLLVRDEDTTGISGTGIVAEGVEFLDGTVVMRWRSSDGPVGPIDATLAVHPTIANVERLHGHGGRTRIVWESEEEALREHSRLAQEMHQEPEQPIPYVAVGADEEPPWGDDLTCPECGQTGLELQQSKPGRTTDPTSPRIVLHYISHCGHSWLRGPITKELR